MKEIHQFFYERNNITPRELANLILGHDPRTNPLNSRDPAYKKTLEKIKYKFKAATNDALDTIKTYHWATQQEWCNGTFAPGIKLAFIEVHHAIGVGKIGLKGAGITLGQNLEQLRNDYLALMEKFKVAEKRIVTLEAEVDRLKPFEAKDIARRQQTSEGGKASKGVPKVFK